MQQRILFLFFLALIAASFVFGSSEEESTCTSSDDGIVPNEESGLGHHTDDGFNTPPHSALDLSQESYDQFTTPIRATSRPRTPPPQTPIYKEAKSRLQNRHLATPTKPIQKRKDPPSQIPLRKKTKKSQPALQNLGGHRTPPRPTQTRKSPPPQTPIYKAAKKKYTDGF